MVYHYCRVSSREQKLYRQIDALSAQKKADRVFTDKESGKNFDRANYQEMKSVIRTGDELYIKELDRLGRNKDEIKTELKWFRDNGVTVRILDIPTTLFDFKDQKWVQEMITNILIEVLGSVAEQEREKIRRRQREGIEAKKSRGDWDNYGRPEKIIDRNMYLNFSEKIKKGEMTVTECCKKLGISRSLWYGRLKETV